MKKITNIVLSNQEPNRNDIWFSDGVLKWYSPNGWAPLVGGTDSSLAEIIKEINEKLTELLPKVNELLGSIGTITTDEIDGITTI